MVSEFDRVYVINLRRRPDRLKAFYQRLAACDWPFAEPIVYPAIEGDVVGVPRLFRTGGGAYGCRMSHLRILQDCLMEDVASVLILEDDADFRPGLGDAWRAFYPKVPDDWEGIMLGGQHHAEPERVGEGVVRVRYAQRTHAYAARRRYMRALQARWGNATVHIDWMMDGWQHTRRVYAPQRWLIGQGGGRSDIRGAAKPPEWWNPPEGDEPVVLLLAPRQVMEDLRRRGWHFGYQRDPKTGIDVGLPRCFDPQRTPAQRQASLARWLETVQSECVASGTVCGVWHPRATFRAIKEVWCGPAVEITARSVEEAEAKLPRQWRGRPSSASAPDRREPVILLRTERDVAEQLARQGWHLGYWREPETGLDRGLQAAMADDTGPAQRVGLVRSWLREVGAEANRDGKLLAVWHPAIDEGLLREAGADEVMTIEADSVDEAIRKYLEG